MIRRPPRSTQSRSSAASDVYKRQADRLLAEGIEATVVDLRSLKPLDWPTIEAAVKRTSKVLIVYEDNEFLGYGAEVSAQISERAFDWLDAPVRRYASSEVPTFPYAASLE